MDKNIEIIRKDLAKFKGKDFAAEVPIEKLEFDKAYPWLKELKFYRVHVGFNSPKDPIPPPDYVILDAKGKFVDILNYLNKKRFMPKNKEEAIESAATIVYIQNIRTKRVILSEDKLASSVLKDVEGSFPGDYLDVPEDVRKKNTKTRN